MTIHVNIGEAKTRLSELLAAAARGEEVIGIDTPGRRVRLSLQWSTP
jgi:antitoxin (DNA-binding transcriptional repressor) of toxin-antitoxin stability system